MGMPRFTLTREEIFDLRHWLAGGGLGYARCKIIHFKAGAAPVDVMSIDGPGRLLADNLVDLWEMPSPRSFTPSRNFGRGATLGWIFNFGL